LDQCTPECAARGRSLPSERDGRSAPRPRLSSCRTGLASGRAAITRRLDRLSREIERLERDTGISVEALLAPRKQVAPIDIRLRRFGAPAAAYTTG
jgi:hypothetical protein